MPYLPYKTCCVDPVSSAAAILDEANCSWLHQSHHCEAFIWNDAHPIRRRIYAALGGDGLINGRFFTSFQPKTHLRKAYIIRASLLSRLSYLSYKNAVATIWQP